MTDIPSPTNQTPQALEPSSSQDASPSLLLRFDGKALANLALGSAIALATLLVIPDSIALIPNAVSLIAWAIQAIGLWISALILWYVSFLAISHGVAFFTKGVQLTPQGIKLWRFGKTISTESIVGLGMEPQHFFSKVFSLKVPAQRLTIYALNKNGTKMQPQILPSYLFNDDEFKKMVRQLAMDKFNIRVNDGPFLLFQEPALGQIMVTYKTMSRARVVLSVIIAGALALFLVRTATVNYLYNSANRQFKLGNYLEAYENYKTVTEMNPVFPMAWQNLAGAEFRLGKVESARAHWERALALKPDLVEPKVSLSYLYIQQRDFLRAKLLLDRALKIAPQDIPSLINLSDLNMRLGHTKTALRIARFVLDKQPNNELATCLVAQGRIKMGHPAEALRFLQLNHKKYGNHASTFCTLVTGEALLETGRVQEAIGLFNSILQVSPGNSDALLDLARARMKEHDNPGALEALHKVNYQNNPWPLLYMAQIYFDNKDPARSRELLNQALEPDRSEHQDANSLALASRLALNLGDKALALRLSQEAMAIEPITPEALQVFGHAIKK